MKYKELVADLDTGCFIEVKEVSSGDSFGLVRLCVEDKHGVSEFFVF